jgi:mannose/cellobiose epimerase-like protein (N-acyl-D-glucosamine 2-epimerase family)
LSALADPMSTEPRSFRHAGDAWAALRRHVLEPFVPRCADREYGGFLVDFDDEWRPVGPHEKSLEYTTRTIMALAMLDRALPGAGCAALVSDGCTFLRDAMWDREHGGFFARVDRAGRPLWDGMKHPHAANYAVRAFLMAAPYLPAGEGEAWAARTLAWLDDVAWDDVHGGYWGAFRRDNRRYAAGERTPTSNGGDVFGLPTGLKEINTQGDAIEMLTSCVERGVGARSRDRLETLVRIVSDRLIDAEGAMFYAYRPDWRPVPDLLRVGYQFMMARHLAHVPAARERHDELMACSRRLVDFCLALAHHPEGGFCFAVSAHGRSWPATGPSSDVRQWWVQVEALYTLHLLASDASTEPAASARYRAEAEALWDFVRREHFDETHRGLREFSGVAVEPEPATFAPWRWFSQPARASAPAPLKTHPWKDTYHEVGALLALAGDAARAD